MLRGSSKQNILLLSALSLAAGANADIPIDPIDNPDGLVDPVYLGSAVDVSAEWLVAGAPQYNASAGMAYIWQRSSSLSSTWSTPVELPAPGLSVSPQFGTSVSIDEDWVAIGAPYHDIPGAGTPGAVVMYNRQASGEWLKTETLSPTLTALWNGQFGQDVDIQMPYMLVGIPTRSFPGGTIGGSAALYELQSGSWVLQTYIMPPWDLPANARFGYSVAITDGAMAVGAPYDTSQSGHTAAGSVFLLDENGFYVADVQGSEVNNFFGSALAADAGTFAVGVVGQSEIQIIEGITPTHTLTTGGVIGLGACVDITTDSEGNMRVAAGSPWDGNATAGGFAGIWTYDADAGSWNTTSLLAQDVSPISFGYSIALHRGTVVVGDPSAGTFNQGTVFTRNLGMSSWIGASGGFWTIAANWSNGVPIVPFAALLSPAGDDAVEINLDDDPHFGALLAGSGHPWLRMAGHAMLLDVAGENAMVIGAPDGSTSARITLDSGFVEALGPIYIGESNAPATLFMEAAELQTSHDLIIGDSGTLALELDELTLVSVTGTASLSGALVLTPPTDFAPAEGTSIFLMSSGAIDGGFRSAVVPSVTDNRVVLDYVGGGELYANVEAFDAAVTPAPGGGDDTGTPFNDLHAADLTGNGRDELILSIPNPFGVGVLRVVEFDSNGAVTATTDITTAGPNPNAIDSGDISGSGFVDLLITEGDESVAMFPNIDGDLANLQYTAVDTWTGATLTDIVVVDWDGSSTLQPGDGPGAIGISSSGSAKAFKNNGGGGLSPRPSIPIGDEPDDGDPANTEEPKKGLIGVEDAKQTIVTLRGSREIVVLGSSDGFNLEVQQRHAVGSTPSGLTVADFNNDTYDDVLVTGDAGEPLSLLLGTAASGLSKALALPAIAGALDAVAFDANNDGWIDVAVVVDDGANTGIGLLRNDSAANGGSLVFTWRTPSELGLEGVTQIGTGDINGNGVDDLIAGGDLGRGGRRSLGGCPAGEILDCNGNCAPADWLGDGYCDDGQYSWNGVDIYFNCAEFNCDQWDCAGCDTDPVGACCFGSSGCQDSYSHADCSGSGGTWGGEESTCAKHDCQEPADGACCVTEVDCYDIDEPSCTSAGGVFHAGEACAGFDCADALSGACCVAGECDVVDTQAQCTGTFYAGEMCGLLTCTGTGTGVVSIMFDPSADPPSDCPGDFNDDGNVNVDDLLVLIGNWGTGGEGDINNDGTVDVEDLLLLLDAYGPCD